MSSLEPWCRVCSRLGVLCVVGVAALVYCVCWEKKFVCSKPQHLSRSCGARLVSRSVALTALGRVADCPRPRRGAPARSSACARRACTARALAGSTRAPSSHTRRRPRKQLRLRCAATHQQRQETGLEDRRARRASTALRTDTFAVLCITAAERAVRALAPVAGRGRWAIVRARRRRNGEQRRTRRAAGRHSEAPPHLPRSRREPRHGALEDRYRQRVTHTHTHKLSARTLARRGRGPHTLDRHRHNCQQATHHKSAPNLATNTLFLSAPPHTPHTTAPRSKAALSSLSSTRRPSARRAATAAAAAAARCRGRAPSARRGGASRRGDWAAPRRASRALSQALVEAPARVGGVVAGSPGTRQESSKPVDSPLEAVLRGP